MIIPRSVFNGENAGKGGQLTIKTDRLSLSGLDTLITSSSVANGGPGGDVTIETTQLNLD